MRRLLLVCLFATAWTSACSGPEAQRTDGPSTAADASSPPAPVGLAAADLVMTWADANSRGSSDFSESLVSRATLDGGGDVYVRLLVTNVAGADGRAELKVRFNLADGRKLEGRVRMKPGGWLYGSDGFDITLGEARAHVVPGRAEVLFTGDGFHARLAITSSLPAIRPAGGGADFGSGAWYRTTIPIPCGRLEGTVEIATEGGEPEVISLVGAAYVEHRSGTVAPYVMAQRWLNLLSVDVDRCVAMSAFQRTKQLGGGTQGWLYYATRDRLIAWLPEVDVAPREPSLDAETGYSVPQTLIVTGPGLKGAIKVESFVKKIDDLGGLSKVERFVVERVMKPWTFRYDASFLLKPTDGDALRGTARYQYQQLN